MVRGLRDFAVALAGGVACVVHCTAGVALAQGPLAPPPLVTSTSWFTWYQALLSQRLSACPLQRRHTYYFSQSGDDSNDGSLAHPLRSLAKAQGVLNGLSGRGDVALLFKRGDTWREDVGIDTATPDVTIADYGTGSKPLFTAFRPVSSSGWFPAAGLPNTYYRFEPTYVSWVKEDDDLDRPYSRQSGPAAVSATEGSWCRDGAGYLFIHPRHDASGDPTDPRSDGKAYEVAHPTLSGVLVRGNGTRVQNIRTQGWGITQAQGTQRHGIDVRVMGTDQAVIVGCESHYGLAHVMTMNADGYGGIATFIDCTAGLTTPAAGGGETMFNTYSTLGGTQTIFHNCIASHGTLPDGFWGTLRRGGQSFYGHTSSNPGDQLGLTIVYGCTTRDTRYGCRTPATFANLTPAATLADVRCFIVNEVFEGGPTTGEGFYFGVENAARVNGRYERLHPPQIGLSALGGRSGGWVINCTLDVDCADQPVNFALFNADPGQNSAVHIWNSHIRATTPPGIRFSLDWDFPTQSSGSTFVNSIMSNSGGGTCLTNIGSTGSQVGNAYYSVLPAGYSGDPSAVLVGAEPGLGFQPACASPLSCSVTPLPGGVVLQYDQRGEVRFRNTIGPIQARPCGNCDQSTASPVFNIPDFQCFANKYALGDPGANCDGSTSPPVLNVADFQCFMAKFAGGCR